jgi:2-beta-glucuronyltransferase
MRAELVLVESGPSLLLIDQLRARAPAAKFVYRVSDGLDRAGSPPFIRRAERSLAARFDLISVPSRHLLRSFEGLSRVRLQPHGIELELFREETPTPYDQGHNACFVGVSHFDHNALRVLSDARRDWSFHILGPIRRKVRAPNVLYYGERPFAETVPYIKHADVGLETVVRHEGMETLRESSLKMLQFEHCGVPIIAPSELRHPRPGVFFYDRASPASLLAAFASAERFRHSNGRAITTRSWLDVARDIIEVA